MATTWAYARVSTTDQNLDRQLSALMPLLEDPRNLITDKASGKDFDRRGWRSLVGSDMNAPMMREGDTLIMVSLDRMGRNYTEIRENWLLITQTLKCNVRILDMPLLDTTQSAGSLDGRFIADLVLQILSYTAEKERLNIKARAAAGIATAKAKGVKFGRPNATKPAGWDGVVELWQKGDITATEAARRLNTTNMTFYRNLHRFWGGIEKKEG
ncbi:recombinase family protein [Fibrobacter sp. UWH6]|uniref:recombinase family protein n=1 Tax=Fibrobacter sp. (strain UWH6) TaxID=1896212 RepID=UPI0009182C7D|nr:recombinase family protein [Fibrobacter sp. UWH6]SHL35923.1 Site-specific DNA recombinase [Fibrobacter sp. UWH6]